MKAFILENIYMSYESAPAVISHSVFSTLDKAKEKVREKYEKRSEGLLRKLQH